MKYYKNQRRDKRITKMTNYPLCFKLKINETQRIFPEVKSSQISQIMVCYIKECNFGIHHVICHMYRYKLVGDTKL